MLSVVPALESQAVAFPSRPADLGSPELRASAAAVATGERVEVVEERSERETVFANPDGTTFTMEKSVAPVRVARQGRWVEPDPTLVRNTDGSVGPAAAAVDLSFSGGGDGADLVTIAEGRQSVSLGWPGALPAPRLDREHAVYEDVLPDVNLILTATVEGFRQVLEVETPEAAANPALKAIEYRFGANGLKIRAGAGGGQKRWTATADRSSARPPPGCGTPRATTLPPLLPRGRSSAALSSGLLRVSPYRSAPWRRQTGWPARARMMRPR